MEPLPVLAEDRHMESKNFIAKLKKTPKLLDNLTKELHEEEFERKIVWIVKIAL